jgi:thiol-disulfide isomerase/thioredoxin
MIKSSILFLISVTLLLSNINGQTYAEQFKKCSETFNITDSTADSLYTDLLLKRDSCLLGSFAPSFKAKTINGKLLDLSKLKGQVIVLNFWSIGCGPCIGEMPELNKLVRHYSGKKVIFISMAAENSILLNKFFKKHIFLFSTIPNSEQIRDGLFKLESILPYSIIIDKEGKIKKIWFGSPVESKDVIPSYQDTIDKLLL